MLLVHRTFVGAFSIFELCTCFIVMLFPPFFIHHFNPFSLSFFCAQYTFVSFVSQIHCFAFWRFCCNTLSAEINWMCFVVFMCIPDGIAQNRIFTWFRICTLVWMRSYYLFSSFAPIFWIFQSFADGVMGNLCVLFNCSISWTYTVIHNSFNFAFHINLSICSKKAKRQNGTMLKAQFFNIATRRESKRFKWFNWISIIRFVLFAYISKLVYKMPNWNIKYEIEDTSQWQIPLQLVRFISGFDCCLCILLDNSQ